MVIHYIYLYIYLHLCFIPLSTDKFVEDPIPFAIAMGSSRKHMKTNTTSVEIIRNSLISNRNINACGDHMPFAIAMHTNMKSMKPIIK